MPRKTLREVAAIPVEPKPPLDVILTTNLSSVTDKGLLEDIAATDGKNPTEKLRNWMRKMFRDA